MSSNNQHVYPLGSAPDPVLIERYDNILTSKIKEVEANFREHVMQCEQEWKEREREALQRETALQRELQELAEKLANATVQKSPR